MNAHLEKKQPKQAAALIPRLEKNVRYQGYRILLRYYAQLGDSDNYQYYLKKSDRRRAPWELHRIEAKFYFNLSRIRGVECCIIRGKSTTNSGACRPPIPEDVVH